MLVAVLHWRNLCMQILFTAYRPCTAIPRYFSLHLLLCFKDVRSQQSQSAPHSNLSAPENVIGQKGAPISNHYEAMKGCVVNNLVPLCFDDLTAILEPRTWNISKSSDDNVSAMKTGGKAKSPLKTPSLENKSSKASMGILAYFGKTSSG